MSLGTISCIFKACDSLRIMSLMLLYFNFSLIFRSKYLSDDWMEDKGFLEKERKEDNNKFWYRIYIYVSLFHLNSLPYLTIKLTKK